MSATRRTKGILHSRDVWRKGQCPKRSTSCRTSPVMPSSWVIGMDTLPEGRGGRLLSFLSFLERTGEGNQPLNPLVLIPASSPQPWFMVMSYAYLPIVDRRALPVVACGLSSGFIRVDR